MSKKNKETQAEDLQPEVVDAPVDGDNEKIEQLMRALAESDNRRKIMEKEKEMSVRYAVTGFAQDVLDIADALDSAIAAHQAKEKLVGDALTLHEGLVLTRSVLSKVFDKYAIEVVDPKAGDVFDHNVHQAISQEEDTKFEEGSVVTLLRKGYQMKERLLRAAFVTVAAEKPAQTEETEEN
ncbi:MAG: nucleotide exchange factor GrpE [Alphaproteobacteria bacterium]|nr:nucleotide exchange factor GrpE [Alphaproteobacteria bacterium]